MLIRTFRPIVRPLGQRIIKRIHNCDKIYHSEKYEKMNKKLQDIENKIINDHFSHQEDYKKLNKNLQDIKYEIDWMDSKLILVLIILVFYKN
jgi:hypothetical protein